MIISSCSYQLRLINIIRNHLSTKVAERVVNALVTSRLDYCNGLLYGLTEANFNRLQRIQNAAARCVLKRSRDSSATAMLKLLHWLPIRKRITFKLLLLVYKAINGMAPFTTFTTLKDL